MAGKCLYCYLPLQPDEVDFHSTCSKKIFGSTEPPVLPYTEEQFEELAAEVVKTQATVPGVQPKISLHLGGSKKEGPNRFTIVGLWGEYILKPPTVLYQELPEVEDLTMHLASIAKINVVPHSLVRMQSGKLAYITKRIDRTKGGGKLHMEDMCQLTERLTEEKYNGSYEQIGKAILKYSSNPGLDLVNFFELVLFSFLTGNADMHLKNFSLIRQPDLGVTLAPAYDLVSTALVFPEDKEDMALTLNGKKRRVKKSDFTAAFTTLKMEERQQENVFRKMERYRSKWAELIDASFLSEDFKTLYKGTVAERFNRIF